VIIADHYAHFFRLGHVHAAPTMARSVAAARNDPFAISARRDAHIGGFAGELLRPP
jgi:hypothetical protein